jgi:hypothetical protein
MTLLAYGDESGTQQGAPFCLVLGYIASPRQWKLFRREWTGALSVLPEPPNDKQREFHAWEFFQRQAWESSRNPYHGWSDKKAADFLSDLLDAIHRYDLQPIGAAVNAADFFAYSEDQRRYLTGAALRLRTTWREDQFEVNERLLKHQSAPYRPYFVAFVGFLVDAIYACSAAKEPEVQLSLDRKTESETRALEVFNSLKSTVPEAASLVSLTFEDSEKEQGLQAADLLAYAWYRELTSNVNSTLLRVLRSLTRKKAGIKAMNKKLFDSILEDAERDRNEAIWKGYTLGLGS